jgi:hypothetical protein
LPRPRMWVLLLIVAFLMFAFIIGVMIIPHDLGGLQAF